MKNLLYIFMIILFGCNKRLDKGIVIKREYKPEYVQAYHPKNHHPPGRIEARYAVLVRGAIGGDSLTEWRYLNPYQYRQYKINDTINFINN